MKELKCNHKLEFIETLKGVVTSHISNLTLPTDADVYKCRKCKQVLRVLPNDIIIIKN